MLDLVTVPCLADNYAYLIHDAETGQTAVRTDRTKTTVAVKTEPPAEGAMVGIAVTADRTNALARVGASPNRPRRVLTTARQRNQCSF